MTTVINREWALQAKDTSELVTVGTINNTANVDNAPCTFCTRAEARMFKTKQEKVVPIMVTYEYGLEGAQL